MAKGGRPKPKGGYQTEPGKGGNARRDELTDIEIGEIEQEGQDIRDEYYREAMRRLERLAKQDQGARKSLTNITAVDFQNRPNLLGDEPGNGRDPEDRFGPGDWNPRDVLMMSKLGTNRNRGGMATLLGTAAASSPVTAPATGAYTPVRTSPGSYTSYSSLLGMSALQ